MSLNQEINKSTNSKKGTNVLSTDNGLNSEKSALKGNRANQS